MIVGGKVVTYLKTNCSKIIRNAIATTGMNEYWMNDLNQPQNSQSSLGMMKNGTNSGPSNAQTALAISRDLTKVHQWYAEKFAYMLGKLKAIDEGGGKSLLDNMLFFWTNELGGASDQLLYILAYDSLADREKKWNAFLADKERLAKFAETESNGPLVRRLTAQMIKPTAYSPMQ